MLYFDTNYIVRLYVGEPGYKEVRELAATDEIACCAIGHTEVMSAFHRKLREGALTPEAFGKVVREFQRDCGAGAYRWHPFSDEIIDFAARIYAQMPRTIVVRSADAIHLTCASVHRFNRVFSNDARLLAAADHFSIEGTNIIPKASATS